MLCTPIQPKNAVDFRMLRKFDCVFGVGGNRSFGVWMGKGTLCEVRDGEFFLERDGAVEEVVRWMGLWEPFGVLEGGGKEK